jgi:hypothetical protein
VYAALAEEADLVADLQALVADREVDVALPAHGARVRRTDDRAGPIMTVGPELVTRKLLPPGQQVEVSGTICGQ